MVVAETVDVVVAAVTVVAGTAAEVTLTLAGVVA
jgi:hypothetical protein